VLGTFTGYDMFIALPYCVCIQSLAFSSTINWSIKPIHVSTYCTNDRLMCQTQLNIYTKKHYSIRVGNINKNVNIIQT